MQSEEKNLDLFNDVLLNRLPEVKGKLRSNAPLGERTWFRVGGAAEVLFKPADREDLINFVRRCPKDVPITVIGVASNLIIRDGGIPGVVIRLGSGFTDVEFLGDSKLKAGVAALDMNVALTALRNNISGLEFLSGIPGTIGGAIRMNGGAYGAELKDILLSAEVLFRDGTIKNMTAEEMGMSYRHNSLPNDVIFLNCTLKGFKAEYSAIEAKMTEIKTKRSESQPIRSKTGGSTFANPEGYKAWELIDKAGCRGLKIGGAKVSEQHANFMINTGEATAADLERLGEEVRRRVYEDSGVMLQWEIRRIGINLDQDADIKGFINEYR